ncbi:DUF3040 domain-containing protein [Nonomuraea sp. K274]|uniref:DUF3040 domain-containing protein n=1 Tax=Nonomuraea cypriaca TaxID=1187855 RepID=A0A931AEB9_9ACTN|nr:DUF3040 domain-containing protein [Nonomuraea cypriaca]MBF8191397.1 DUF3040 domain-containing protein [Nonomuraea cypriaca]
MSLSDRERRMLAEIEQDLRRRDRAFAARMDALSAARPRMGPQRFACEVSRREIVWITVVVVVLTALSVLIVLVAGPERTPPVTPVHPPGTVLHHTPAGPLSIPGRARRGRPCAALTAARSLSGTPRVWKDS